MNTLLNRHGVGLMWSFVVVLAAFLFYIFTAAFIPYPGLSSEYLTALCYPAYTPELVTSPLDVVVFRSLIQTLPPTTLSTVFGVLNSLVGALIVACLFRSAIAVVRHSCLDLTGIRTNELDRTLFIISHTSFATGLGTSLLALTLLPLWTIATRLYPQNVTALVAVITLTFALHFRWYATMLLLWGQPPKIRHGLCLGLTFAGATFLALTQPILLPVSLFALLLTCSIFFKRDAINRLLYIGFAGGGLLTGLLGAVLITTIWAHLINVNQAPLPSAFILWANHLSSALPSAIQLFTAADGAGTLILFLVAGALFLGTFPFAYMKAGTPIIGQIACVALGVITLLHWPQSVWYYFEEPNALCLVSGWLIMLCCGGLIGSWLHILLERAQSWDKRRIRTIALSSTCLCMGAYAVAQGFLNAATASGRPMQQAMADIAPILDALLPKEARLWITTDRDTLGLIARRTFTINTPLQPQKEDFSNLTATTLQNHATLGETAQQDPLVRQLATLGGEPLRQYLLADQTNLGILTHWNATIASVETARAARLLEETPFGQTNVGQRCIIHLKRLSAREHAVCALRAIPEVAATHLRIAKTLDPENPGIKLSLAALEAQGVSVTQEERDAARDVLEAEPRWRAPSESAALNFEYRYGPVQTPGFCSASRLRRFHLGNAPAVLDEILHLYRTAPEHLSPAERSIAILNLPEAEVAEYITKCNPESGDMELFFCLYPDNPLSETLYQEHRARLKGRDALTVLFRNRTSNLHERTADKMLAFFLRDGTFAYALYHLNALLTENQLDDAIAFAGSFNVRERLAQTPALIEELRYRVLNQLASVAPARAHDICEGWLRSNPQQYRLWSLLLTTAQPTSITQIRADIETCLLYYPLHPIASQLYADLLEDELGSDVATRYRHAIKVATEAGACIQKDAHAHRRL